MDPGTRTGKMNRSVAPELRDSTAVGAADRLERPGGRRAHGNDAPALVAGAVDRVGGRTGNAVLFAVEPVILDPLDPHRLKRSVPDVQRDLDDFDLSPAKSPHERAAEVQACRRRRDRTASGGEYRLIPLAIRVLILAFDVRRQRDVAHAIHRAID